MSILGRILRTTPDPDPQPDTNPPWNPNPYLADPEPAAPTDEPAHDDTEPDVPISLFFDPCPHPDPLGLRAQPPPAYQPPPERGIQRVTRHPAFGSIPTGEDRPPRALALDKDLTPWERAWARLTPAERAWSSTPKAGHGAQ